MNKRALFILIGVVALFGALLVGVVSGGALAVLLLRANPVQAAIGVQQEAEIDREAGVLVSGVDPDSPAAQAGVVRGDIIQEINGAAVNSAADLLKTVLALQPGDAVELRVLHGDEIRRLTATLAASDEDSQQAYLGIEVCGGLSLGDSLDEVHPFGALPFGDQPFHEMVVSSGATVMEVLEDSPAAAAGLQPGDVINSVGGQAVDEKNSLGDLIAANQPGATVELEVARAGETLQIQVALGENPDDASLAYLGVRYVPGSAMLEKHFGEGFENLPEGFLPHHFNLPEGIESAVIVTQVLDGSPAAQAELQSGDLITAIDGVSVESPEHAVELIQKHKPGDAVELQIVRRGQSEAFTLTVTLAENPDIAGQAYLGVSLGGFLGIEKNLDEDGGSLFPGLPEIIPPVSNPAQGDA